MINLCLLVFQHDSTNKTDSHDITEILLKVALNSITLTLPISIMNITELVMLKNLDSSYISVIDSWRLKFCTLSDSFALTNQLCVYSLHKHDRPHVHDKYKCTLNGRVNAITEKVSLIRSWIQYNLSKPNLLGTRCCVRNRQVFDLDRLYCTVSTLSLLILCYLCW